MHNLLSIKKICTALCIAFTCLATHGQTLPDDSASLYQSLGQQAGITLIVQDFVPLLTADTRINTLFKETNLKRLRRLLTEQICNISGGGCDYTGDNMKLVHQGMHINDAQFNALVEDLQTAMDLHSVPPSIQNKLIARLAPMHRDIVQPK